MTQQTELSTRDIERVLIDGHWRYGSLVHLRTAEALVGVLAGETDSEARHILFSRLFGEFAASLETFAAWGWALRNRFKRGSFLNAYLSYSNQDEGNFFAFVRDHNGDLTGLLRLPPVDRIVEMAKARNAELPEEGYAESLRAMYDRLKEAAETYYREDRVVVDAYNKTKHGAPMLRLFEPEDERKFEIVTRARVTKDDPRPYRFPAFMVTHDEINKQLGNVSVMTGSHPRPRLAYEDALRCQRALRRPRVSSCASDDKPDTNNGRKKTRKWSQKEIDALLEAADIRAQQRESQYDYSTLIRTAVFTGLRLGELLGLQWGDVDLENSVLHVRRQWTRMQELAAPKTKKGLRRVPLTADLVKRLREHKLASRYSQDEDFVFPSLTGGALSHRNAQRRGFEPARDLAEIDDSVRFHDLRHAFASIAASRGIPVGQSCVSNTRDHPSSTDPQGA